jgi:hypothetical protein
MLTFVMLSVARRLATSCVRMRERTSGLVLAASALKSTSAVLPLTTTGGSTVTPAGNAVLTTPFCNQSEGPDTSARTMRLGTEAPVGNQRTSGTRYRYSGS